jgi:hypothetical protein
MGCSWTQSLPAISLGVAVSFRDPFQRPTANSKYPYSLSLSLPFKFKGYKWTWACTVKYSKGVAPPMFFLGFLASLSPGDNNFTSTDFLATKKILRQTSKKTIINDWFKTRFKTQLRIVNCRGNAKHHI